MASPLLMPTSPLNLSSILTLHLSPKHPNHAPPASGFRAVNASTAANMLFPVSQNSHIDRKTYSASHPIGPGYLLNGVYSRCTRHTCLNFTRCLHMPVFHKQVEKKRTGYPPRRLSFRSALLRQQPSMAKLYFVSFLGTRGETTTELVFSVVWVCLRGVVLRQCVSGEKTHGACLSRFLIKYRYSL